MRGLQTRSADGANKNASNSVASRSDNYYGHSIKGGRLLKLSVGIHRLKSYELHDAKHQRSLRKTPFSISWEFYAI